MNKPVIGLSMNFMQLGQYHQFHIRDKYIDAVFGNGGLPLPLPCLEEKQALRQYLEMVDALIVIGGMDYPPAIYGEELHPKAELMNERRVNSDLLLMKLVLGTKLPVLGICAGMQLLNIATGGKLIQHLPNVEEHYGEKYHEIRIAAGSRLYDIFRQDRQLVNSNHHQGINPDSVGKGFKVAATTSDGTIEAMELEGEQFVLGIQWHPERMTDAQHRKTLFEYFIRLAGEK